MKSTKIAYWIFTGIIAAMMLFSAYTYLTNDAAREGFKHVGFPDYFRIELAIAKILGVIALLAPVHPRVKEWAYAGFGINFISAVIAHAASGDPIQNTIAPIIFIGLLIGSYITYHKIKDTKTVAL